MVIEAFKMPNKPRKSENYWKDGEQIGGYRLELPTLRAVVSQPDATLRKGFSPFRSVEKPLLARQELPCEYIFQGDTFSCNWLRQKLMMDFYYVIRFTDMSLGTRISCLPHKCFVGKVTYY